MTKVLLFLQTYEFAIYIVLGLSALIIGRKLFLAWREWRGTVFGLERESAQRRFSGSASIMVIIFVLALVEFILVSFIIPATPAISSLRTPTINLLATSTIALPSQDGTATVGELPGATQPVSPGEGCIPGQIEWTFPASGASVSGTVELKGTVNIPTLGFYKYEYSQSGGTTWMTIAAGNQAIVDGTLGVWNTDQLTPGDYFLRLVVTDSQNQVMPACTIPVIVTIE